MKAHNIEERKKRRHVMGRFATILKKERKNGKQVVVCVGEHTFEVLD